MRRLRDGLIAAIQPSVILSLGLIALSAFGALLALFLLPEEPLAFGVFEGSVILGSPRALAALSVLPLFIAFALRSRTDLSVLANVVATGLRVVSYSLVVLVLSSPQRVREEKRLAHAVLFDVSDSMSDRDLEDLAARINAAKLQPPPLFLRFASRPERIEPSEDNALHLERPEASEETDLASALLYAAALLPSDHHRRILIVSDGRETQGDAAAVAARLAEIGIEIHALRFHADIPGEIALLGIDAPPKVEASRPFTLRAKVETTRPARVRLELKQGGLPNALEPYKELDLDAGVHTVEVRSIAHHAGPLDYTLTLTTKDEDRFEGNNRLALNLSVEGRPSVLIVSTARSRTHHLADALSAAGFEVSRTTPASLPTSREAFAHYRGIFLVDLHASDLSDARQRALLDAARLDGITLVYSGGERSYGLGDLQGTRLAEALPVSIEGEKSLERPALALSLVIDKSGSMAGVKMELAKQAARAALDLLSPEDLIQIVGFDSRPARIVRMQSVRNRLGIRREIAGISASGGTAIVPALEMAHADLSLARAELKHVILFTDGQARESGTLELVRRMRAEGITVSTIGLGSDVERALLERIASLGGGRSHFTADPHHIPRLFVNETRAAMRSSAIEIPASIRQVGRSPALRGIPFGDAPLLRGYIATRIKPRPVELLLETSTGDPLLARRKLGLGSLYAWTSDLEPRWASGFLRWRYFSVLLAQLLREEESEESVERLAIEIKRRGRHVSFHSDAISSSGELLSGHSARFSLMSASTSAPVRNSASRRTPPSLQVGNAREVAPGVYSGSFELPDFASYRLALELYSGEALIARGESPIVYSYPDEWAALGVDESALEELTRLGGGALHNELDSFNAAPIPPSRYRERIVLLPLSLALLAFLLDLLIRRTRLFDRLPR